MRNRPDALKFGQAALRHVTIVTAERKMFEHFQRRSSTAVRSRQRSPRVSVCSRTAWLTFAALATIMVATTRAADVPPKRTVRLPGPSGAEVRMATAPSPPRKPTYFKSAHFVVHTDLKSKEAHELLNRLEVMLSLISKYWGQPPAGTIECYVVKDLAAWPDGSIPLEGLEKIRQSAGITTVETLSRGLKVVSAKATVFAKYGAHPLADGAGDRGTPQHEAVHAYCGQAFGRTGPLWYAEGMAEMGRYWRQGDVSVHCDSIVVDYLKMSAPKSLAEIVSDRSASRTGDSWQNYAWRWALCHLLESNPNYSTRFRALGLSYLNGAPAGFGDTFGSMLDEIAFEYRQFLTNFDQGYRVDLCSWDWKRRFKDLAPASVSTTRVNAQRGWQPTGVIVRAGESYDFSASGTWQTSKDTGETGADGGTSGVGRLEAAVFADFVLSKAFPLGAYGSFTPTTAGQLFVRCSDKWNELADNRGTVALKIKRAGDGAPLPKPKRSVEAQADEGDDD